MNNKLLIVFFVILIFVNSFTIGRDVKVIKNGIEHSTKVIIDVNASIQNLSSKIDYLLVDKNKPLKVE